MLFFYYWVFTTYILLNVCFQPILQQLREKAFKLFKFYHPEIKVFKKAASASHAAEDNLKHHPAF